MFGARHQSGASFDAEHLRAVARDRQRKVAQAAEEICDALTRLRVEQAHGAADHHAIQRAVYLGEFARRERHGDAEFGQAVGKLWRIQRMKWDKGIRPPGLQPELNLMFIGKGAQRSFIFTGWRLHHAQHQRIDELANRHFDLWQFIPNRQAADQLCQERNQRGDLRREDFAALHVGDEAAALFVKADQRLALFDHVPDRDARALAISPGLPVDRRENGFRLDLADVPQAVFENALLDRDLRVGIQMLHRAAAAHAEILALRLHAHRSGLVYLGDLRQLEGRFFAIGRIADRLAGQRAFDEDHLAVQVRNTASFLVEGFNDY